MADQNFPSPKTQLVLSQPGVRRDGTLLSKNTYSDMLWSRFYQDRPRKMGGYRETERNLDDIAHCLHMFGDAGVCYVHAGSRSSFQRFAVDENTDLSGGVVDRTPAGYTPSSLNLWQADSLYYAGDETTAIIAAATPSLHNLTSVEELPCYYGDVTATDPLTLMIDTGSTFALTPTGMADNGSGAIRVTVASVGAMVTGQSATITGTVGTIEANGTWWVTKISATEFDLDGSVFVNPWVSSPVGSCAVSDAVYTSGGLCAIATTTFIYGHDGLIRWSSPINSFDFTGTGSGESRPASTKVLKGLPVRGSAAPAGIFWSIDSVILAQYVGTPLFWSMTTLTTSASLLGQNVIIENNGIYYWATLSGFSQFNGVVRDLPNEYNKRWFLDNLNLHARNKCFAYKVPSFSEIWWCFPFGDAEECTHAVIYNYEKNYWYDTELPNGGRAAGAYNVTCPNPLMSGIVENPDNNTYSVWSHEFGVNQISGSRVLAIRSHFETSEFSLVEPQQFGQLGDDKAVSYSLLEPDYDQVGDLNFYVTSRANARATPQVSEPIVIPANPTPNEQLVKFKKTGRLTRFKIESNVVDGNYVCGSPLIHFQPSDGRRED